MIIKTVSIENYMCYYERNRFDLSKGLNVILGENGEGKTKFFEALDWLFKGRNRHLDSLISAKKLNEANHGDEFEVIVEIVIVQFNETKVIRRSFGVTIDGDDCITSSERFEALEENDKGERYPVDAERLLDQCFPSQIRRYSMFKGESELGIFENNDALPNLIELFAESKHYQKYSEIGDYLFNAADKAVADAIKKDRNKKNTYNDLEISIKEQLEKSARLKRFLREANLEINRVEKNIENAENYVDNAQDLETINKRLDKLNEELSTKRSSVDERYTINLFDENWILSPFEDVFKEFEEKVNKLHEQKRKIERQFIHEEGIKKAEAKVSTVALEKLFNESIPLPKNVPNKEIMEELIRDEICKICGRPAKKGSDPHDYMVARLNDYLESQKPKNDEKIEEYYDHDYTSALVNMVSLKNDDLKNLRNVRERIKDQMEFNAKRKEECADIELRILKEENDRTKIIGESSKDAGTLTSVLKNYNAWQADLKDLNRKVVDNESGLAQIEKSLNDLRTEKGKIDLESANSFLVSTREITDDINTIFKEIQKEKFDLFIKVLEDKSNLYFDQINKGAFTGSIKFDKRPISDEDIEIVVQLIQSGRRLQSPNQSLETSMHISVLFAISKLAEESREESYPLIFDAPTSSFGETKMKEFLNIIANTDNQIIILVKDFIGTDKHEKLFIKDEFGKVKKDKAFWIRLERPFDRQLLHTLNTEVITL